MAHSHLPFWDADVLTSCPTTLRQCYLVGVIFLELWVKSTTYQSAYYQNAKMEEETKVTSILSGELTSTDWKNAVVRHQDTQQPQGHHGTEGKQDFLLCLSVFVRFLHLGDMTPVR